MAEQDPYKTLGVSREASADEIRKAYKKLSRENHPDMKPNDKAAAEKFRQVQDAYEVLGDAEKREQFDRYGSAFRGTVPPGAGGGPGGGRTYSWSGGGPGGGAGPIDLEQIFGGGGGIDLGDLFSGVTGGGGGRKRGGFRGGSRPQAGENVPLEADVPFQVAVEGGELELQLRREAETEKLTVKVPPGVETGSVIRLSGQGHPGSNGGPSGDLLLTVKVAPHPWFRREGKHLLVDVPITVSEAALGAKVEAPTLVEGPVVVTIPPGTSSGAKLRLRGKGAPDRKTGERGDQYVVVKIVVPTKLDDRAKRLFEELSEAAPLSPRTGLW